MQPIGLPHPESAMNLAIPESEACTPAPALPARTAESRAGGARPGSAAVALGARHCPITRQPLGGLEAAAPVLEPLRTPRADGADAPAPKVLVSRVARDARDGAPFLHALTQWRHLQTGHAVHAGGLGEREWLRWAVLLSFVTPLADVDVARLPLVVMPPAGLALVNPLQRLQRLITRQLAAPGWSLRLRRLAEPLAADAVRHDFQCFVAALAPRVIELPEAASGIELAHALEDLWCDRAVQRRWQHVALLLGRAGAERLLRHATRAGLDDNAAATPPRGGAAAAQRSSGPRSSRAVGSAGTTLRPLNACDRPRRTATRSPRWLTTITS